MRIEARHPSAFLEDLVNSYRSVDDRVVMPEDAQRCLLYMLQSIDMFREELHHNPSNNFKYRSSSYNSREGNYVVAAGGNGPPQSVDGSFYHSHTNGSFAATHPIVDLTTYESKHAGAVQPERSRKSQSKKSKPVQEPAHLTVASNRQDCDTTLPAIAVTVTDTGKPIKLAAAPSAPVSSVEQELQAKIKIEEPEQSAAIAAFSEEPAAELDIALSLKDEVDDSGIAMDDVSASETHLTDNVPTARKSTNSPSRDSTYGTQSQVQFGGNPLSNSEHTSDASRHPDVKATSNEREQLQSSIQSRKKLAVKTPLHGTRRSSRLSTANTDTDTQVAPPSSLGKHGRKTFKDAYYKVDKADEPKVKRNKAT